MTTSSIARLTVPLSLMAALLAGCGEAKTQAQGSPPPPPTVSVAKPVKKLVAGPRRVRRPLHRLRLRRDACAGIWVSREDPVQGRPAGEGRRAVCSSSIRARSKPSLDQSKAAVEQAKANLAFAESDLKRGESLRTGTTITQQALDQRLQASRVAAACGDGTGGGCADRPNSTCSFTELKAPISGRIGDRRVSIGNLVSGGSTGTTTLLATIASIDPIRFEFTMDEASYLRYLRLVSGSASNAANRGMTLPVRLKLIDEDAFTHEGKIDFVDNAIDRSSGTIRGRAEFANADGRLTPGMFGRIQIATSAPAEALLVPDSAVGTEQVRKFVYVLDGDNVATPKYVTLGQLVDNLRVVQGLKADDTVVVNGLMRVRPGAKVTPEQAAADAGSVRDTSSIRTN